MEANKEAIFELMKEHGLTVTGFAKELGMRRESISGALHGHNRVGAKFIGAFAKRFPDKDLKTYFSM